MSCVLCVLATILGYTDPDRVHVARPGQILTLKDSNHDGDFLDFGESSVYAEGLSGAPRGMVIDAAGLFAVDSINAAILKLSDLNADGDALDFGEVTVFAQFPAPSPPTLTGLAALATGGVTAAASNDGTVYLAKDVNGDGDALDAAELITIAAGAAQPLALAARSDNSLLLAQNLVSMPIRILEDRNADGDFLDFAENISYAENSDAGADIFVDSPELAFMSIPAGGQIVKLQDLTSDGDVLDFGEIVPYAGSLPGPRWLCGVAGGPIFVGCDDVAGSVFRIEDKNNDGDALDFGEAAIVAQGLTAMSGLVAVPAFASGCTAGDLNSDGQVTLADVPLFANALLAGTGELCRVDINGDTLINGRDIRNFVALIAD